MIAQGYTANGGEGDKEHVGMVLSSVSDYRELSGSTSQLLQ